MLALAILNYTAFYFLLRRTFGASRLAATGGAFLFAFGSVRVAHPVHQQLNASLFLIGAIYILFRIFANDEPPIPRKRLRLMIVLFFVAVALEAWASYYLFFFFFFFFFGLLVGIVFLFAMLSRSGRRRLLQIGRDEWPTILASTLLAAFILMPFCSPLSPRRGDPRAPAVAGNRIPARSLDGPGGLADRVFSADSAALGIAFFVDAQRREGRIAVAVLCLLVMALEQTHRVRSSMT